jgi:Chs5-Arf1p-binding protein BUD7/BCH1
LDVKELRRVCGAKAGRCAIGKDGSTWYFTCINEYLILLLGEIHELGPPDLVHLVKGEKNSSAVLSSTYHFITGADCSSSASCAAYLNACSYQMTELYSAPSTNAPAVAPAATAKLVLKSGTYCCWNPFRQVDVRVEVKIPGGVEYYAIAGDYDKRLPASEDMWDETFVAAILRSFALQRDSPILPHSTGKMSRSLFHQSTQQGLYQHIMSMMTLKQVNPLPGSREESLFLKTASKIFPTGPLLGCDSIQIAPI